MKKLNKFAAALAAMVMALSFAGCSDNEEKDSGFDPSKVSVPKGSKELKSKEDVAALELAGNWKLTGDYIAEYVNNDEISKSAEIDDIRKELRRQVGLMTDDAGVISGTDLKTFLGYMFYDDDSSDSGYDDEEEEDDDDDDYEEYSSGVWFAVSEDTNTLYGYMWKKSTYTKKYWDEELKWFNDLLKKDFKTKKELFDHLKGLSDEELDEALKMDKSDIELIDKYWGASSESKAIKFTFTKQS